MHRRLAYYSSINNQNADWLSSYGRMAKIGVDPICYTERRLGSNGCWNGNSATEFFMYATQFLRNFRNGNGKTATEWWKPGINSLV